MRLKQSLKLIADKVSISDSYCEFEGIVNDYFVIKDNECWVYTLVDGDKKYPYIQVRINRGDLRALGLEEPEYLLEYRVNISGDIVLYEVGLVFQVQPTYIAILDDDNATFQRNRDWHSANQTLFNKKEKREIQFTPNLKIGLIAHSTTRGYDDFITHLNVILKPHIEKQDVTLNYKNIIAAIGELQETCDFICIVSGGGSQEFLSHFSQPELVKAIFDAKIPIVTGVGHQKDVSDSDRVADYNANTPTNAANYINECYAKYIEDLENQNASKDTKIQELETELKILKEACGRMSYAK